MENKKRLKEAIEDVHYPDLLRLEEDLKNGGKHIRELVVSKIAEYERNNIKCCATCGISINPYYIDDFQLTFGRHDFKKRAYFCGLDCLKYFLAKLEPQQQEIKSTTESF